jgi:hypothetical protein
MPPFINDRFRFNKGGIYPAPTCSDLILFADFLLNEQPPDGDPGWERQGAGDI